MPDIVRIRYVGREHRVIPAAGALLETDSVFSLPGVLVPDVEHQKHCGCGQADPDHAVTRNGDQVLTWAHELYKVDAPRGGKSKEA